MSPERWDKLDLTGAEAFLLLAPQGEELEQGMHEDARKLAGDVLNDFPRVYDCGEVTERDVFMMLGILTFLHHVIHANEIDDSVARSLLAVALTSIVEDKGWKHARS